MNEGLKALLLNQAQIMTALAALLIDRGYNDEAKEVLKQADRTIESVEAKDG